MNLFKYKVSYAQNREDYIINAFFSDIEKGFYVDVGANHPFYHSVTKIFNDKGWTGINIEPNPMLMEQIKEHRKKDVNLQVGVSNKTGEMQLRVYHSRDGLEGISTFSKEMQNQYSKKINPDTEKYDDIKVEVTTLEEIFKNQKTKHIHFIKIDVEGHEREVIEGNNWIKYRPELICIESNHVFSNWKNMLVKSKYQLVFNDGLNDYYLREESIQRRELFDYAKVFLSSNPVLQFEVAEKINKLVSNLKHSNADPKFARNLADARLNEIQRIQSELDVVSEKFTEIISLKKHIKKSFKSRINKK